MAASTNSTPAGMHAAFRTLFLMLMEAAGVSDSFVALRARLSVETAADGQSALMQIMPLGGSPQDPPPLPIQATFAGSTMPGLAGVPGTLAAGTVTVTLANKTNDVLVARLVTSGGTPGACFSCQSASATTVKVNSQTAAGALQNADTSTIEVYNLGNFGL